MKTSKLITALIVILLFSNFMFAGSPITESSEDISNKMVENTNNDVNLSANQRGTLKLNAKEYADKLIEARTMSDKEATFVFMKTVTDTYLAAIDSILTPDQKNQIEKKNKERIDLILKKTI